MLGFVWIIRVPFTCQSHSARRLSMGCTYLLLCTLGCSTGPPRKHDRNHSFPAAITYLRWAKVNAITLR